MNPECQKLSSKVICRTFVKWCGHNFFLFQPIDTSWGLLEYIYYICIWKLNRCLLKQNIEGSMLLRKQNIVRSMLLALGAIQNQNLKICKKGTKGGKLIKGEWYICFAWWHDPNMNLNHLMLFLLWIMTPIVVIFPFNYLVMAWWHFYVLCRPKTICSGHPRMVWLSLEQWWYTFDE